MAINEDKKYSQDENINEVVTHDASKDEKVNEEEEKEEKDSSANYTVNDALAKVSTMTEEEALSFIEGDTRKTLVRGVEEMFAPQETEEVVAEEVEATEESTTVNVSVSKPKRQIYPTIT